MTDFNPFALEERTITHEDWGDNTVVIRELPYAEKIKIDNMITNNMTIGDGMDETSRKRVKMSTLNFDEQRLARIASCIVSWTFTNKGSAIKPDTKSIGMLGSRVAQYLEDKIKELNPETDDEFRGGRGDGDREGDKSTA